MSDKKYTIGIDARLCGLAHAGLGRYIKNLCLRLPFVVPEDVQLFYFFANTAQWDEVRGDLPALDLPSNINSEKILSAVHTVTAAIPHYSLAEQTQLPRLFARAHLDLLHAPHFNLPYFPHVPRTIVTIHDLLWHEKQGPEVTTLSPAQYHLKYAAYRALVTRVASHTDAIITPSQTVADTITHYYPRTKNKLRVIHNGTTNFRQIVLKKPKNIDIPDKFILYVGSLYPHKNVEFILPILERDPDLHLMIVSARDAFLDKFRVEAGKSTADRVHFMEKIPDSTLKFLYSRALCLVQPSLSEGFGFTGIEAMNCDCLVAASDIPIFREIYADHYYSFDPTDFNQFASVIRTISRLTPMQKMQTLRQNREFASQYSWEQMVDQVWQLYQAVLESHP